MIFAEGSMWLRHHRDSHFWITEVLPLAVTSLLPWYHQYLIDVCTAVVPLCIQAAWKSLHTSCALFVVLLPMSVYD